MVSIRVYIDPYAASGGAEANHYYVVGYKGSSPYDAGIFYCPYVPLQMVRAVGENSFQPKIGFKTRYGMVANPFAEGTTQGLGILFTHHIVTRDPFGSLFLLDIMCTNKFLTHYVKT
jgi:hypothetical protein